VYTGVLPTKTVHIVYYDSVAKQAKELDKVFNASGTYPVTLTGLQVADIITIYCSGTQVIAVTVA
jgi:hypothetical protein